MSDPLGVWLRGQQVGTLTPTRRGASFTYSDDVAEQLSGQPLLSTSLPVRKEPFDALATRSWFSGLLPEDAQREDVIQRFNLRGGTYVDLLREIGWECAGAVVITSDDAVPHAGRLEPLADDDFAARLAALPGHPYDTVDALRVSLGGYQAKMLVTQTPAGWALPVAGAISTHIVKPQSATRWPHLIAAEAWVMAAAQHVTSTATAELLSLEGAPLTLLVERFDRSIGGSAFARLHQEDACQAMGIPPESKYASSGSASKGDPSLEKIATLLRVFSARPERELERLLQQVTINVAVGNTDAHAKNYGIIHGNEQTISLSPMYDVLPAAHINPGTVHMGMRVGNVLRLDRVTPATIADEAVTWGIARRSAFEIITETLERLFAATDAASELYPDTPVAVTTYVTSRIAKLLDQGTQSRE